MRRQAKRKIPLRRVGLRLPDRAATIQPIMSRSPTGTERRRRGPALRLMLALVLAAACLWGDSRSGSGFLHSEVVGPCAPYLAEAGDLVPAAFPGTVPDLRAVTYNLHAGLGARWRFFASRHEVERNLRAIAARIASAAPDGAPVDVIALNEADFGSRRSGWLDQAAFLAAELQRLTGHAYHVVRGETWHRNLPGMEVRFGNAALLRHPVLAVESHILGQRRAGEFLAAGPVSTGRLFGNEPRGVLRVRIDFHGLPLTVLVTHLEAFATAWREAQAAEIMERFTRREETILLLGDMNAAESTITRRCPPATGDRTHHILSSGVLADARVAMAVRTGAGDLSPWATYPAQAPRWPLDGAFATPDLAPRAVRVIGGGESDHRGLFVHYGWTAAGPARPTGQKVTTQSREGCKEKAISYP